MTLEQIELELQKLPEDTAILVFRVDDDTELPAGEALKLEAHVHGVLKEFGRDMPVFVLCGVSAQAISKRYLEAQLV